MLTDFLRKVSLGEDLGFGGVIGRKGVSRKAENRTFQSGILEVAKNLSPHFSTIAAHTSIPIDHDCSFLSLQFYVVHNAR